MYTEDQMTNQFQEKKDKKIKLIIIISVAVVILIGIIIVISIALSNDKKKTTPAIIEPTLYTSSKWTNGVMEIKVDEDDNLISEYSFDGGKTWQEENFRKYEENCTIEVVVKDKKGLISNPVTYTIDKIDKTPPTLLFEEQTTIQINSKFNPKENINVEDKESGISKGYTVEPATVDTSKEGTTKLVYTVTDNAGNTTTKERTIIVKDTIVKRYYRSRTSKNETYDCNGYSCNCKDCSKVTEKATIQCPGGYSVSNGKCVKKTIIGQSNVCGANYTLQDGVCKKYVEPKTKTNCINGFKLNSAGNACELTSKFSSKTVTRGSNGCPSGYYPTVVAGNSNPNQCVKSYKVSYIYQCNDGVGTYNSAKKKCKASMVYACRDYNYPLLNGKKCYTRDRKNNVAATKVCPSGYYQDGTSCYREAEKKCPTGPFMKDIGSGCSQDLYLLQGSAGVKTTYTYCSNAKLAWAGSNCSASYPVQTVKYCSTNYTLNADKTKCLYYEYKMPTYGCPSGYSKSNGKCVNTVTVSGKKICPANFKLESSTSTTCRSTKKGQCCSTCYKKCSRVVWGEWSEWTTKKILASSKRQVETKTE